MNKSKFSLAKAVLAALLLSAALFLVGCNTNGDEVIGSLCGDWVSSWGEKYAITETTYDNYSHYDASYNYDAENWYLYYSTDNLVISPIDETSGYIYCQFDDAAHIGYGAEVGQWYALYYQDLTDTTVSFGQPYKADGKAGCDTLSEAKKEYTLKNKYFDLSNLSECVKQ